MRYLYTVSSVKLHKNIENKSRVVRPMESANGNGITAILDASDLRGSNPHHSFNF